MSFPLELWKLLQNSSRCETRLPFFRIFLRRFYRTPSSESTEAIEGFGLLCPTLVSYVDDITCLIKIQCIDRLFRLIDTLCKRTQMMINIRKSEVLSIPDILPYKTDKETKILGVLFYTSQKVENIELLLSSQI